MKTPNQRPGVWLEPDERVWRSRISDSGGGTALGSGTAYAAFMGRVPEPRVLKYISVRVTSAGAGAQTAEIGTFYSLEPPNKVAPVLYPWETTGSLEALTGTGAKRNAAAFGRALPKDMWLWLVVRTAMATTQPSLRALENDDRSTGYLCQLAGASALTGVSSLTMTLAIGPIVPSMYGEMD